MRELILVWCFSLAGDQGLYVSDHLPSCSHPPACHLTVAIAAIFLVATQTRPALQPLIHSASQTGA